MSVLLAGVARVAAAAAGLPVNAVPLDAGHVEAAVESVVRQRWAPDGEQLEVAVEPLSRPVMVPARELTVEAYLAPGITPHARVPIRVRVACEGRAVASLVVWAQVKLWKPVLRTRLPLARDTILTDEMVEPVEIDIAAAGVLPFAHGGGRHRLRQALPAGTVLQQRHVTTLALVARNDVVRLRSRHGEVEIDTEAVATTDAPLGGIVVVRPAGSPHTLSAVVVGPRTVTPKD